MKHLSNRLWLLSVLVLIGGCGGGGSGTGIQPAAGPVKSPAAPSPSPTPALGNIAGNWKLTIPAAVPGASPATIAGSITQSEKLLGGVVHANGWNCFDYMTPISLSGELAEDKLSLVSAAVNGQVIAIAGSVSKKTGFPMMSQRFLC
jgi:hypothetical protein